MDQLDAMRLFVLVIKLGSFSAAARQINTSQSSASKKVASLEQKLGVKLINRTSRELVLTQAGEEYHHYCLSLITELDEVENRIRQNVRSPKGVLRVAAPPPVGNVVLAPLLNVFLKKYPDIEVDLCLEDRHVDLIAEGIDVAIRAQKLEDSSLVSRFLFSNKVVMVASPAYLKVRGTPTKPSDLKQHNCIVYTFGKSLNNWHFTRNGDDVNVQVKGDVKSNNGETNVSLALNGQGITKAPEWMVKHYVESGRLVKLLNEYEVDDIPMHILYPQNRQIPLKVRCFIDFVIENIDQYLSEV